MEFTDKGKEVIKIAGKLAKEYNHPYIGTEHLLLGLLRVYSGVAGQILDSCGVDESAVLQIMEELVSPVSEVTLKGNPEISPRLNCILEESKDEAAHLNSEKAGTEHMLLALLKDADCVATRILMTLNIDMQKLFAEIFSTCGVDPKEYQESFMNGPVPGQVRPGGSLDQFGEDLTAKAAQGSLDPIIGRKDEMQRILQILARRTKNNPCLVGEPGVGKTAIVEGLAQQIAEGIVPDSMKEKRIFTMDLAGMVAGTKYRGEFEERIKELIKEVKAAGNIILFLDEIHTIIGAGGAEGALDAANILKPALSRGEIQLIGATTIDEYRKHIEKDAALERRFQPVTVEEPSKEECVAILNGLKGKYEAHHHVTISENALSESVNLSVRYISDRFLPDKALDVLDEACAKANLKGFKVPAQVYEIEKRIKELTAERENALKAGKIADAASLNREKEELEEKLVKTRKNLRKKHSSKNLVLTENDIAEVVSQWTKIPVQKLQESESKRLQKLENTLHKRVIGQEEAVSAVSKAIRRGRVGLKDPKRPIGSFLFLGPTGVGKTELSKALSEALFGSEEAMIRVDMSEYMEKHTVSKMIGSPPGYVGHEEGGQLSEQVRRHPYSVVLFDEIEKAHPDVFNILLQVLDDGHITDSQGRKVDFCNTVIIMTSNAGAKTIMEPKKLGFNPKEDEGEDYKRMKNNVMKEIKHVFRPEFLNRIDEIQVFHPLNNKEMKQIVSLLCKDLTKRAKEQLGISLTIRDSVKQHIVETGTDKKYGARPLKRAVQNQIEDAMAEALLNGEIKRDTKVVISMKNKKLTFITAEA